MTRRKSNVKWLRTVTGLTLTVSLLVPLLAACGSDTAGDDKTERVLRIATNSGPDDEYFRQQFTDTFEITHKNIKIELVPITNNMQNWQIKGGTEPMPDPLVKLKELMTGPNPPDLALLSLDQLPDLVNNNMLLQLDPLITKDKFDTSDIVPTVLDGLKNVGEGKLYALSPTFTSSVLMYNRKLFDEAGVPYPKDEMTWDETFELARRVAKGEGENRKYGFGFSNYSYSDNIFYDMNNYYSNPLQFPIINEAGDKMTVDSDRMESMWKTMQGLMKDKVFPEPPDRMQMSKSMSAGDFNPFQNDMFKSGRLAMTIAQSYMISDIISTNKNATAVPGFTPIDWDIATIPTHSDSKGMSANINLTAIMGINAKAQNPKDAWTFLKFINGEEWAQLKSRSVNQLVSRKKYIQPRDGLAYNVKAQFAVKPIPNDMNKLYRDRTFGQVQSMGNMYFRQAMDGTKGIRDALKEWQTAGNAAIQQLKDNPNGQINMGGAASAIPMMKY